MTDDRNLNVIVGDRFWPRGWIRSCARNRPPGQSRFFQCQLTGSMDNRRSRPKAEFCRI